MKPDYSLIIPTWNGLELLKKNLSQVFKAIKGERTEVLVVENGSQDKSLDWLRGRPEDNLRIIPLNRNRGFSYACNLGAKKARGKWLVLINNDVFPEPGFLTPLKKYWPQKKVFAVSFHEPQSSWAKAEFKNGFFHHSPGRKTNRPHFSAWASGGSAAFRRSLWFQLGGLDLLFHPFYWEDTDLSYRAWKRGFQVYWDPKAVVHHHHQSTINRFSRSYVDLIRERNELLFLWKNIASANLLSRHFVFLLVRLFKNPGYSRVVFRAFLKLPQVLKRRRQELKAARLTDEAVFAILSSRTDFITDLISKKEAG